MIPAFLSPSPLGGKLNVTSAVTHFSPSTKLFIMASATMVMGGLNHEERGWRSFNRPLKFYP